MFPSSAITCSRATASTLPTMSRTRVGRYFSTCARVQGWWVVGGQCKLETPRACHVAVNQPARSRGGPPVQPAPAAVSSNPPSPCAWRTHGSSNTGLDVDGVGSTSIGVASGAMPAAGTGSHGCPACSARSHHAPNRAPGLLGTALAAYSVLQIHDTELWCLDEEPAGAKAAHIGLLGLGPFQMPTPLWLSSDRDSLGPGRWTHHRSPPSRVLIMTRRRHGVACMLHAKLSSLWDFTYTSCVPCRSALLCTGWCAQVTRGAGCPTAA